MRSVLQRLKNSDKSDQEGWGRRGPARRGDRGPAAAVNPACPRATSPNAARRGTGGGILSGRLRRHAAPSGSGARRGRRARPSPLPRTAAAAAGRSTPAHYAMQDSGSGGAARVSLWGEPEDSAARRE